MLAKLKDTVKAWLLKRGYEITSVNTSLVFENYYKNLVGNITCTNDELCSLVFSKDRAMQLHAFLESYFENVQHPSKVIILYKASTEAHQQAYKDVEEIFEKLPVQFIAETNFRAQLIEVVKQQTAQRILMYVDDMIFTQPFDYSLLQSINPYETIVSLSRGLDLTYSPVLLQPLELPAFTKANDGLMEFRWDDIKTFSDWSYPLGVSGYMFSKWEIVSMMEAVPFKAPNSLETALQIFMPYFKGRKGICTVNAVSVCIHANITQTEGENPVHSEFTIDNLLEKWNEGLRIDYSKFYHKPINDTQVQAYTFVNR